MPEEETKPESMIEKAERLNKELDEKIKKHEDILKRTEELKAEMVLGGHADAGQPIQKEKPKEETPAEYADRVMSGNVEKK